MSDYYGFPIKTKSNAGPKIKWCGGYFETPEAALSFAQQFDRAAANNAKMNVNLALRQCSEESFEIPAEQMNLEDEVNVMWRLSYVVDGVVLGSRLISCPCLKESEIQTFAQNAFQYVLVEYVSNGQTDYAYPNLIELLSTKKYEV